MLRFAGAAGGPFQEPPGGHPRTSPKGLQGCQGPKPKPKPKKTGPSFQEFQGFRNFQGLQRDLPKPSTVFARPDWLPRLSSQTASNSTIGLIRRLESTSNLIEQRDGYFLRERMTSIGPLPKALKSFEGLLPATNPSSEPARPHPGPPRARTPVPKEIQQISSSKS